MKYPISMRNYGIVRGQPQKSRGAASTAPGMTQEGQVPMCSQSTPKRDKFTRTSPTQIQVHCSHCDRAQFVVPSKAKRQARFYCDMTCRDANKRPLKDRFLGKVHYLPSGCWRWTGFVGKRGYGMIAGVDKYSQPLTAHRVSFEIFVGSIPDGLVLDHTCRNRWCVNPDHLRTCTQGENAKNMSLGRRNTSGYIGVHFDVRRNKWVAMVSANGKSMHVGRFATAEEAAVARDLAAKELYGEFANLNFPEGGA